MVGLREWAEEQLAEDNPDALFMDGLDDAIIGVGRQYTKKALVVYDYDKIVESLVSSGMDYEDAVDYAGFNILDAWFGENTPFIINVPQE